MQNLGREHGQRDLEVSGVFPPELVGTFYRNVPAVFDLGEPARHWFDAHAAVCAMRFGGGRVQGSVKIIETPGFVRERAAGKRLYGRFGTPMANPFREMLPGDRANPAGTSFLSWNGRLYATSEAGKPVELAPESLVAVPGDVVRVVHVPTASRP